MALYEYINSKRSASGFLKDLADIEQRREQNYVNNNIDINTFIEKIAGTLNGFSFGQDLLTDKKQEENDTELNDFANDFDDDFDDDLDD